VGLTNSSSGHAKQLREQSTEQLIKEYEAFREGLEFVARIQLGGDSAEKEET